MPTVEGWIDRGNDRVVGLGGPEHDVAVTGPVRMLLVVPIARRVERHAVTIREAT